jgi:hypothetical protein
MFAKAEMEAAKAAERQLDPRLRPYVGFRTTGPAEEYVSGCQRSARIETELLLSLDPPTPETHPGFDAIVGPFKTQGAARLMAFDHANPSFQSVAETENTLYDAYSGGVRDALKLCAVARTGRDAQATPNRSASLPLPEQDSHRREPAGVEVGSHRCGAD